MCVCVFVQKVDEEVDLKKGSHVRVVTAESDKDKTDGKIIWVDYPSLPKVLTKGAKIYIDDGLIGLKVLEIGDVDLNKIISLTSYLLFPFFMIEILFILQNEYQYIQKTLIFK